MIFVPSTFLWENQEMRTDAVIQRLFRQPTHELATLFLRNQNQIFGMQVVQPAGLQFVTN